MGVGVVLCAANARLQGWLCWMQRAEADAGRVLEIMLRRLGLVRPAVSLYSTCSMWHVDCEGGPGVCSS